MKRTLSLMLTILCLGAYAQITKPIGINISGVSDYATELSFTDAFKQCRKWISSNAAGGGPGTPRLLFP